MAQTTASSQAQGLSPRNISWCHCWTARAPRRALCTGLHSLWMANNNISWPHRCTLMLLNHCRSRNSHFTLPTSPRVWWTSYYTHWQFWACFSIQQIALVPVPELCKLQQSWIDLWISKSICENWQHGKNYELQHQGVCIQSCTPVDFGKTYYQSVFCSCLKRFLENKY